MSVIMGTNLADHKGNVTAYLNYRSADPVSQGARDFSACKLNVNVTATERPLHDGDRALRAV
jgi:hypothetical protein